MRHIHTGATIRQTVICLVIAMASLSVSTGTAAPIPTRIVKHAGGWQLERNGKPFVIKGAGGSGDLARLAACGANSIRTWGADDLESVLDEAHKLGLAVTIGIWLGHERHGFDYTDADAVSKQEQDAREAILRYKDHPALLMWGIGNEMEGYEDGGNPGIWMAVNRIAGIAKELDPNHPTMTVSTEIGGKRVGSLHRFCPNIDIMGINSYGGAPSIPERYRKAGGTKPYVVTEYGPPGVWEVGRNELGAPVELTSTAKAESYARAYRALHTDKAMCLGSYAFTWGSKQEATATWFGLLLPDGSKLGAVDALTQLWSGRAPANCCPRITELKLLTPSLAAPGSTLKAALKAGDPDGDPIAVTWILQRDVENYTTGGDHQAAPPTYPEAIVRGDLTGVEMQLPPDGGLFRVYAYLRDGKRGAAVGNLPLRIDAPEKRPPAIKATIPLSVYSGATAPLPYLPSGWMGNIEAIKAELDCTTSPHSGSTCVRVTYGANDGWGGIVWQHPDGDWGDRAGGFDLSGARALSIWARGEKGGEKVTFELGLIGRDKPYYDTAKGKIEALLTTEWQEFKIDVSHSDLSRIKTGFAWIVAGQGKPITFFLDDIRYH